jgi:DNA-directed RNA polymerase subunit N (RpoN/RPB10)
MIGELEEPPTELEQHQLIEEGQRPTVFVSRIYGIEPSEVPPEVAEYRRLSKEERALKIPNPRLLMTMPLRCMICKKVIKQLAIEEALKSGKTLRKVYDEQGYIRMCCRSQIGGEQVVVNLQNEMASQRSTMNLSIASTGFGPTPIQPGVRIIDSASSGFVEGPCPTESFMESNYRPEDAYNLYIKQLNNEGDDDY